MSESTVYQMSVVDDPSREDEATFHRMLREYNRSKAGPSNYKELCIFLRNKEGEVVGGVSGQTYWEWLFIENLAVAESVRARGLGSQLLKMAEKEAVKRGCRAVYLDTFSFQALPFYQKHGYSVFGELEEFPPGFKRHFLWKLLNR